MLEMNDAHSHNYMDFLSPKSIWVLPVPSANLTMEKTRLEVGRLIVWLFLLGGHVGSSSPEWTLVLEWI